MRVPPRAKSGKELPKGMIRDAFIFYQRTKPGSSVPSDPRTVFDLWEGIKTGPEEAGTPRGPQQRRNDQQL